MPLGFVQDLLGLSGAPRLGNRYQAGVDASMARLDRQAQGMGPSVATAQANAQMAGQHARMLGDLNSMRGGAFDRGAAQANAVNSYNQQLGQTAVQMQQGRIQEQLAAQQQLAQMQEAQQMMELRRNQAEVQAFNQDRQRQAQALGGLASLASSGGLLG